MVHSSVVVRMREGGERFAGLVDEYLTSTPCVHCHFLFGLNRACIHAFRLGFKLIDVTQKTVNQTITIAILKKGIANRKIGFTVQKYKKNEIEIDKKIF